MKKLVALLFLFAGLFFTQNLYAHCDSYDGPVVQDAYKALETNNVSLVLKWISKEQEPQIKELFNATYKLRGGNKEVYALVEQHFLETLVRLHRETENAPYTGLKAAGTTKPIIKMSDEAIANQNPDKVITALNNHIGEVIREKYEKVERLSKVKDSSPEVGREYVDAYVDYTHTIEGLHDIVDGQHGHQAEAANHLH